MPTPDARSEAARGGDEVRRPLKDRLLAPIARVVFGQSPAAFEAEARTAAEGGRFAPWTRSLAWAFLLPAAVLGPVGALMLLVARAADGATARETFRALGIAGAFLLSESVLFLALGIGTLLRRRWAGPLLIHTAGLWLLMGAEVMAGPPGGLRSMLEPLPSLRVGAWRGMAVLGIVAVLFVLTTRAAVGRSFLLSDATRRRLRWGWIVLIAACLAARWVVWLAACRT